MLVYKKGDNGEWTEIPAKFPKGPCCKLINEHELFANMREHPMVKDNCPAKEVHFISLIRNKDYSHTITINYTTQIKKDAWIKYFTKLNDPQHTRSVRKVSDLLLQKPDGIQ